ncbi:BAG family molecular chaperone regulator 7-like [Punica granatum]|uniref:BAG family molecular chaperone regulator 7-like n=1 Tax=Punica granatum TaxID=22663 RepID=A0A6P8D3G6_PUNGR|nr:BAG family molecular chaperone regulator 7-like [Punica granatum]
MSLLRRVDMMELDPFCPAFPFLAETSIFVPTTTIASPSFLKDPLDVCFALDHLSPQPEAFEFFDALTDLIQAEKPAPVWSYGRIRRRVGADSYLQTLCDRVEVLGSRFDRLHNAGMTGGRKYTWTAEVEGRHADRKYKWVAEINQGKEEKKKHYHHHHHNLKGGKSYKWTAEIKEKGEDGPIKRTYTWKSSTGDGAYHCKPLKGKKKEEKKLKKGECATRLVEIEELNHHGAVVLRQAFAKRTGVAQRARGKKKELSPQDAASMIQMSFKAYLLRRSQALRALRELAVAKTKLKEVRALFNNFTYRSRIAHDAEERQRFAERIIVVLLTVDAIEGVDLMVRAAKKSMTDELEAMLDVVDPQPLDKYLAIRRRRMFDVPDGHVKKEVADGVAQIVRMLDQDEKSTTSTSEV